MGVSYDAVDGLPKRSAGQSAQVMMVRDKEGRPPHTMLLRNLNQG